MASQLKGVLTLLCSLVVSVAAGFASRRFDQPGADWHRPAFIAGSSFLVQLGIVFMRSKEERELEEFKRIQSARNQKAAAEIESQTKTRTDLAGRIQHEIRSGNLDQAERWADFQRRHIDAE